MSCSRGHAVRTAGAGALSLALQPQHALAQAPLPLLRFMCSADEAMLPFAYADRNGLFRKNGVDVQFTLGREGLTAAVVGGAQDVATTGVLGMITARSRGIPLVLIAPNQGYESSAPNAALLVAKASPIRTARDLNGKNVAIVSVRGISQVIAMAWVDQHGGDSRSLKFVEIPYAAEAAALVEGRVDAAVLLEPFLSDALARGCRVLGDCGDALGDRWLETGYFCTRDFAAKNAAAVTAFARTIAQANAYVDAHQAQLAPLLSDVSKIPPEAIARMTRTRFRLRLDAHEIQSQIDAAARYGIIPSSFDAATLFGS